MDVPLTPFWTVSRARALFRVTSPPPTFGPSIVVSVKTPLGLYSLTLTLCTGLCTIIWRMDMRRSSSSTFIVDSLCLWRRPNLTVHQTGLFIETDTVIVWTEAVIAGVWEGVKIRKIKQHVRWSLWYDRNWCGGTFGWWDALNLLVLSRSVLILCWDRRLYADICWCDHHFAVNYSLRLRKSILIPVSELV